MSWKTQADCGNIYNTPNIFSIWALECITADLLAKGGLVTAGLRAKQRADLVSLPPTLCTLVQQLGQEPHLLQCVVFLEMYSTALKYGLHHSRS